MRKGEKKRRKEKEKRKGDKKRRQEKETRIETKRKKILEKWGGGYTSGDDVRNQIPNFIDILYSFNHSFNSLNH